MADYLVFIITFAISMIFAPFYIKFAKKVKFGQTISEYVGEHNSKQGTPTMGGLIFILPTILVSVFFFKGQKLVPILCLCVFSAYALVGFLDDYIKIKFKRNLGLRPYQKIIFQLLIAIIVAVFAFRNPELSQIWLPFSKTRVNFGWLVIPYIVLVFLATTNSVNLTDGLDGLAGSVSFVFFVVMAFVATFYIRVSGEEYALQAQNLNLIFFAISGGLLAFLVFNFFPAKIFMGDTGSLALGGLMSVVCVLNGTSLYIPIVGLMFVVSSVSVILQVLHFKRTRKRIFLMAPFHHHLEHKGMYETKIVFIYIVVTFILGLSTIFVLSLL